MRVSTKLRAASALQIGLLAVLLVHHVRTIRDTVSAGYELTEISSRAYHTANEQAARIEQFEENAAKYVVTRDVGYLQKYEELTDSFTSVHSALLNQPLTASEREAAVALGAQWATFREDSGWPPDAGRFEAPAETGAAAGVGGSGDSLLPLMERLDTLRAYTQRLSEASQEAMLAQLARNTDAARRAERLSWMVAGLALIVSVIVSTMIVRSIADGLSRLAAGTREVARGRFGHRLDGSRGDEFGQLARDFNTMTMRLDELDTMKRDFVSKVSHDLKTPLASMQETIVALLDEVPGPLLPKQRRLLELNHQSGERLYGMLAKLLDLSRLEAGVFAPKLEDVDIVDIVEEVAEFHSADGAAVDVVAPDTPVTANCDRDRVLQLVHNLVENAVKFASPGGVTVAVDVTDRIPSRGAVVRLPAAHIIVSDDGPGVSDADKSRVFDRFVQGEPSRTANNGVGLGLTICREIVTVHGGAIWIQDRPAGGSEFHVLLPDARNSTEGGAAIRATRRPLMAMLPLVGIVIVAGCATSQFDRHFAAGRLDDAARAWATDSSRHTDPNALYRAALAFAATDLDTYQPELARELFARIVTQHPASPHAASSLRFIDLLDEVERVRNDAVARRHELDGRIAQLESEAVRLRADIARLQFELDDQQRNASMLRAAISRMEASLRTREEELVELRTELDNLKAIDLRAAPRSGGAAQSPPAG